MNITAVTRFLKKNKIWHKVEGRFIKTRRKRVKIPEVNEEVAYLTGAITGDGTITTCKRKKGGHHYLIRIVGRKEYLSHLTVFLDTLFEYKPRVLKDKRKRNCYLINISCAALYAYFVQLGLPVGKKNNLSVPNPIATTRSLFRNYMLGLIDTDGYIDRHRVQLKQREKKFLIELVKLLEKKLNVKANHPKINYTNSKPYYYIRFPLSPLLNSCGKSRNKLKIPFYRVTKDH